MRRIGLVLLFVCTVFSMSLDSSFAGALISSNQSSINSDTFSQLYEKSRNQVVLVISIGKGAGSGFIWINDGYVLTNSHVVEGAKAVEVYIDEYRHYPAKVVGADPEIDVAVLKIDVDFNLTAVTVGNSDQIKIGDLVYAIGAPLFLRDSLSVGVVGGLRRYITSGIQELIQLDLVLNPGNSGGPLYDLQGRVIGMNVMTTTNTTIGFAIPINDVIFTAQKLLKNGKVKYSRLGVSFGELAHIMNEEVSKRRGLPWPLPQKQGIVIVSVEPGSPANKAGLQPGDIIISFNNKLVGKLDRFRREVAFSPSGVKISMVVKRADVEISLQVELEERPALVANKLKENEDSPPAVPTPTPAVPSVPDSKPNPAPDPLPNTTPAPSPTPVPAPTPGSESSQNELNFGKGLDFLPALVRRSIREYQGVLSELSLGFDGQIQLRSTNAFAVDGQYVVTVASFLNSNADYAIKATYIFNGIRAKLTTVAPYGIALFKLETPYLNYKTPIVWSDDVKIGEVYHSLVIKNSVNGDNLPYTSPLLSQVGSVLIFNVVMKKMGLGAPIFNGKGEVVGIWFAPDKDSKDPEDVYDSTVAMPAVMIKKMVEGVIEQRKK